MLGVTVRSRRARTIVAATSFALLMSIGALVTVAFVWPSARPTPATQAPARAQSIAGADVSAPAMSSSDIAGLPLYPGAIVQELNQATADGLTTTRGRYTVAAPLEAVRVFHREVFQSQDWTVVDVGYRPGRWRYFVILAAREADITLRERSASVSVTLDVTEPAVEVTSVAGRWRRAPTGRP